MSSVILSWYLVVSVAGWLAFPLAFRLLGGLSDRGYTASRALGLLLWGYIFWMLASLGVLRNDSTSLLFALALVACLSAWALNTIPRQELLDWWRSQRWLALASEALFLAAFAGWAAVRAANPEAIGTEKPMELAFINAILSSPTFPPHDPWLSGYAISYYYFGYVLVAMLARLTSVPGALAFNLGSALVFALAAIGAYGLLYNLLTAHRLAAPAPQDPSPSALAPPNSFRAFSRPIALIASLLGPLYVLILSNLEGILHVLHSLGIFWRSAPSGELTSAFWRWLDIKDLNLPPQEPFTAIPSRFWWWWRASRVIQDYDLAGNPREIIDEFPFFSFLLADLHPHVLVIPFTFLAIALALNLLLDRPGGEIRWLQWRVNLRSLAWAALLALPLGVVLIGSGALGMRLSLMGLGILALVFGLGALVRLRGELYEHGASVLLRADLGEIALGPTLQTRPAHLLLAAVALGGMAFLNTWDFPFYVALYAAAYALGRLIERRSAYSDVLKDFTWMGLALGLLGGLLYLPFYLGFSSQAGGILPNLISPTRGVHLWIMFGPLLLPIFAFLLHLSSRGAGRSSLREGFKLAIGFGLLLWILSLLLGLAIVVVPQVRDLFLSTLAAPSAAALFQAAFLRRLVSPGGWLTLLALLGLVLGLLLRLDRRWVDEHPIPDAQWPIALIFTLLLILWGTLLVLGPEFLFLRDLFGWRMNTIFKFYYQAWLLWSIAAAYASAVLLRNLRGLSGALFTLAWLLVALMGLVYPALSLDNKTNGFKPATWTLDSSAYLAESSPDEMDAIRWLASAPPGVVAEAVPEGGGSYTSFGRVSMISGQPAVLGWVGHESQWRGGGQVLGSRQSDLERLYCTRDWEAAKAILDQYNVRYIFIGSLERSNYQPGDTCPLGLVETKFSQRLTPVYEQGGVTIYEYRP
ncbi:MAG: hypothetical protein JXA78_00130 [Anaerolineales bacterium]|nr:hypothetical protein [Anaerolineales bacterium]